MSEQRETWGITFRGMDEYDAIRIANYLTHTKIPEDRYYKAVRIPPPAEIEANARDAERYRVVRYWYHALLTYTSPEYLDDGVDMMHSPNERR